MKFDTERSIKRVKSTLEACLNELHGIHNDAYSRCDTEAMIATHPAWEGVKNLLAAMPQKVRAAKVRRVHKHLP